MEKQKLLNLANKVIEETKKEQEKYHEERLSIFKLVNNLDNNFNLEILDNILKIYEKNKNKIDLIKTLEKRKFRKEDLKQSEKIILFMIQDKENKIYTFFTRESARDFITDNAILFEADTEIKPVENTNIDLERIINNL